MGWFKKLLSLGDSEDEEPEEMEELEIPLTNLSDWVQQRSDSGFDKIRPEIKSQFESIKEEKDALREILKDLSVAELHNPDIPERERQIMEGNREAYIKQHRQFLNNIDIPEDLDCAWTSNFCKAFEEMLVSLAKSSAKGHAIMDAFFAKHAANVNKSIKRMGNSVSRIKEILEDGNVGVENIDEVQKAVATLKSRRKLIAEVSQEEAVYRQKLENSRKLRDKIQGKMDELKQTQSYSEFQEHNTKREGLWKQVRSVEEEIDSLFSPLGKPMKKYERVITEGASLFAKYLDNPVNALAADDSLQILSILEKMQKAITSGSLEVKDPEKAVSRIAEVSRERLSHLKGSYADAKTAIKNIDDKIRRCSVLDEINDLQYKLEHTENQIKILDEKISISEKTQDKVDLDALKTQVEQKIKDAFDVEVKVTWPEDSEPA